MYPKSQFTTGNSQGYPSYFRPMLRRGHWRDCLETQSRVESSYTLKVQSTVNCKMESPRTRGKTRKPLSYTTL